MTNRTIAPALRRIDERSDVAELAYSAASYIERLEELVQTLIDGDPQEPISDSGHVVLDLWRHQARELMGLEEVDAESDYREREMELLYHDGQL